MPFLAEPPPPVPILPLLWHRSCLDLFFFFSSIKQLLDSTQLQKIKRALQGIFHSGTIREHRVVVGSTAQYIFRPLSQGYGLLPVPSGRKGMDTRVIWDDSLAGKFNLQHPTSIQRSELFIPAYTGVACSFKTPRIFVQFLREVRLLIKTGLL